MKKKGVWNTSSQFLNHHNVLNFILRSFVHALVPETLNEELFTKDYQKSFMMKSTPKLPPSYP
jgi:hypothetical protein